MRKISCLAKRSIRLICRRFLYRRGEHLQKRINSTYKWIHRFSQSHESLSIYREIDVFHMWPMYGSFFWGLSASLNLYCMEFFEHPYVLELGCANGFYANRIYSFVNGITYLGCDLDENAIAYARKFARGNLQYIVADFLKNMPLNGENLTNVLWNESINMFDKDEIDLILRNIYDRLHTRRGVLSGAGVIKCVGIEKWNHYKFLFQSTEELRACLEKYFPNVWIASHPEKENGYTLFCASEGTMHMEKSI